MAVLPGYFEKEKSRQKARVAAYTTPVGDAGASMSSAGAAPAATSAARSAPTATPGGGSGFVNFGSYFGANAPAIQAQAQKSVEKAKGVSTPGFTAQVMPTTVSAGGFGNVSVRGTPRGAPRSDGSYESRIAEASRQFESLNPAAQTGTMAAGTSLFDQMLGGGVTQRAAQAEQQRLGALRKALEEGQAEAQHYADLRTAQEAAEPSAEEQAAHDAQVRRILEQRRVQENYLNRQDIPQDTSAGNPDLEFDANQIPDEAWDYDYGY